MIKVYAAHHAGPRWISAYFCENYVAKFVGGLLLRNLCCSLFAHFERLDAFKEVDRRLQSKRVWVRESKRQVRTSQMISRQTQPAVSELGSRNLFTNLPTNHLQAHNHNSTAPTGRRDHPRRRSKSKKPKLGLRRRRADRRNSDVSRH